MVKDKVAISLDEGLLHQIDGKVDGNIIRSRSQAIEFYLRKGLREGSVTTAVLLLKGEYQHLAIKEIHGVSLIKKQIEFFVKHGIKRIFLVTQHGRDMGQLLAAVEDAPLPVNIIEQETKGNADALHALRGPLKESFIAMSADTFNDFDLQSMVKKHLERDKLATMGLMTTEEPSKYGNAVLDNDLVVDFQEKPKSASSPVVNAGIYIFKPEVFELFSGVTSLEKDLFPKLAKIKQLVGFFTHGAYLHVGN